MLTKTYVPVKKVNSITVQCKFLVRLKDLETDLNLEEPKIKLADCQRQKIKEFLMMNFDIADLAKSADEILELEIVDLEQETYLKETDGIVTSKRFDQKRRTALKAGSLSQKEVGMA